jgi:hypothetical protein
VSGIARSLISINMGRLPACGQLAATAMGTHLESRNRNWPAPPCRAPRACASGERSEVVRRIWHLQFGIRAGRSITPGRSAGPAESETEVARRTAPAPNAAGIRAPQGQNPGWPFAPALRLNWLRPGVVGPQPGAKHWLSHARCAFPATSWRGKREWRDQSGDKRGGIWMRIRKERPPGPGPEGPASMGGEAPSIGAREAAAESHFLSASLRPSIA